LRASGFDGERIKRVAELADRYVEAGKLPGAQVQVAHKGEIALRHTVGHADVAAGRELRDDAIYRIYSMTKPITSIALMQLYEQGLFMLEDPVERFLPEFADAEVLVGGNLQRPMTRPAQTTMTVKDVLCHTSGLTYGFFYQNNLDAMYREHSLGDFGLPEVDLATATKTLASLPLQFDPGTAWNYSMSTDVCGRLVEVISGHPLDEYISAHITRPLGMVDAGFHVPADDRERFTTNYAFTPQNPMAAFDPWDKSRYLEPALFSWITMPTEMTT